MTNVTKLPEQDSILAQAKQQVAKEKADKAKTEMVKILRDIDAAEAVVKGLHLKLEDLRAQVDAGTF